jgi:hypothetical protein
MRGGDAGPIARLAQVARHAGAKPSPARRLGAVAEFIGDGFDLPHGGPLHTTGGTRASALRSAGPSPTSCRRPLAQRSQRRVSTPGTATLARCKARSGAPGSARSVDASAMCSVLADAPWRLTFHPSLVLAPSWARASKWRDRWRVRSSFGLDRGPGFLQILDRAVGDLAAAVLHRQLATGDGRVNGVEVRGGGSEYAAPYSSRPSVNACHGRTGGLSLQCQPTTADSRVSDSR